MSSDLSANSTATEQKAKEAYFTASRGRLSWPR